MRSCHGDIIVCLDDDDYYPPTRISHAVERLIKSGKDLAGCTRMLILDDDLGVVIQLHGMHDRHGVHSTMAYTRKYARTHKYDTTKTFAEEASFTLNFTEPMVQLDGQHVFMQISHFQNTFSKKKILLTAMIGDARVGTVLPNETPEKFLSQKSPSLLKILRSDDAALEEVSTITFYCGLFSIVWDPTSQSLGGSEQAVVEEARCFAARGLSVCVYANFAWNETRRIDGVNYHHANTFRCRRHYDVLVLWRFSGMVVLKSPHLRARRLVVDLHDHIPQTYQLLYEYREKVNLVLCKSNFQVHLIKSQLPNQLPSSCRIAVVPNGVRVNTFEKVVGTVTRRPKHLVYASSYTRGLESLLKHTWPVLHHLEPEAVFHVCYGMEHVKDPEYLKKMNALLKQPGVVHHGRLDVLAVASLKASCGFHLYYTPTSAEIDCISIRESLVVGCIPILSHVNVFGERPGFHIKDLGFESRGYVQLARVICEIFSKEDLEEIRTNLRKSPLVMDWEATTAEFWSLVK